MTSEWDEVEGWEEGVSTCSQDGNESHRNRSARSRASGGDLVGEEVGLVVGSGVGGSRVEGKLLGPDGIYLASTAQGRQKERPMFCRLPAPHPLSKARTLKSPFHSQALVTEGLVCS